MMFRMKLRSGEDVTFHEWNTLKADLMYEYGYDKECLYNVLEQFVSNGVYRDMALYIAKDIDFSEIRVIEDEEIENPKYFCETWLLTSNETGAAYPTLREAIDFVRYNHDFLKAQAEADGEETSDDYEDAEVEQYVRNADGNSVFEIRFDGKEKQYF